MHRTFVIAFVALGLGACKGGGTCPEADQVCGSNGKTYCHFLPDGVTPIDRGCCPVVPVAGPDAAATQPPDAAADLGDVGVVEPPDAAEAVDPPDAATPAGLDAGEDCGDGGFIDLFYGYLDAGLLPSGRDDGGLPYVYRCGVEVCRLPPMPFDAGQTVFLPPDAGANCGPLGCN